MTSRYNAQRSGRDAFWGEGVADWEICSGPDFPRGHEDRVGLRSGARNGRREHLLAHFTWADDAPEASDLLVDRVVHAARQRHREVRRSSGSLPTPTSGVHGGGLRSGPARDLIEIRQHERRDFHTPSCRGKHADEMVRAVAGPPGAARLRAAAIPRCTEEADMAVR